MTGNEKIKVLIGDAQFLTGFALEHILNKQFSVQGWVCSKEQLINKLQQSNVLLLILDYALFDIVNLDELASIKERYPLLNILVLTSVVTKEELSILNRIGIKNIILKTTDDRELFQAIDATLKGKKYYSQEILDILVELNAKKDRISEVTSLTATEIEIVKMIAQGFTTKEIANRKFISFHTVMTHRKNIFRKLNVSSVSELIMHAIKAGWIDNIEYYI